jgi:hypothetical protein
MKRIEIEGISKSLGYLDIYYLDQWEIALVM